MPRRERNPATNTFVSITARWITGTELSGPRKSSNLHSQCKRIRGFHFDAAIEVHPAFPELVMAEGLQRQRRQGRLLFGEQGGYLALGGAVDARIGPVGFPTIQVGLGLFQAFKAQSFEWRILGVAYAARFARAGRGAPAGRRNRAGVGGHLVGRFCQRTTPPTAGSADGDSGGFQVGRHSFPPETDLIRRLHGCELGNGSDMRNRSWVDISAPVGAIHGLVDHADVAHPLVALLLRRLVGTQEGRWSCRPGTIRLLHRSRATLRQRLRLAATLAGTIHSADS